MTDVPVAVRERRRATGYEYLTPLFVERAALPVGHPCRERLRAELIVGFMPVARHIAWKYAHHGDSREDLEQVAALALVLAVDRFDAARGVDFLAFAIPTISGEVLRYFRDRTTAVRMPRRLRELQPVLRDAARDIAERHGRAARPSEIATAVGMPLETVLEVLQSLHAVYAYSLDEPTRDGEAWPGEHLRFGAALRHVEAEFDLVEQRQLLGPLLARLDDRDRRILLLRFFHGMTQTEIAAQMGVSQMQVSRLLARTLRWLRKKLAD
jgi:RNA polymerase sigma-B factor